MAVLLAVGAASIVALPSDALRPYALAGGVLSLGLAALLVRGHRSPASVGRRGYEACPRCGSEDVERVGDDIRYVAWFGADMLRHYVRCTQCGHSFESRVGGGV